MNKREEEEGEISSLPPTQMISLREDHMIKSRNFQRLTKEGLKFRPSAIS